MFRATCAICPDGHLDGAARALLQYVQAVVLACQCGTEVFRAEVVDELHLGLIVAFQFAGGNDPTERVVLLAQIARQRTIKFLSSKTLMSCS